MRVSLDETSAEFKAMKEEWQRRAADVASIDEACALAKEIMALDHDYGTYVHACRISIKAMTNAVCGHMTGFQANFLARWVFEDIKGKDEIGFRHCRYSDLIYPQEIDNWRSFSKEDWEIVKKRCAERLAEGAGHPDVREHWKKITEGWVPDWIIIRGVDE